MTEKKPTKIWFLVWPDGKMFEGTQTSISESRAISAAILTWLTPKFFPGLDLGGVSYGVLRTLWNSMEEAGFKCHCIDTEADGVSY